MNLREQLGKPVLFHWLGWHGKDNKPSIPGYDSRDVNVISRQLRAMRVLGGDGCGVLALTFGNASSFIQESVLAMWQQCSALQMPFGLCFDPWAVKNSDGSMPSTTERNNRMITAINNPDVQKMLHSDCYLRNKPILDFATGCDKQTIEKAVQGITYLLNGPDYDWVRIPPVPNKTTLPCVYMGFDDGTGADRNKSCWDQSKPARIVKVLAGDTFWSCNVEAGDYVQYVTWNDYSEGTAIEPFASMLSLMI